MVNCKIVMKVKWFKRKYSNLYDIAYVDVDFVKLDSLEQAIQYAMEGFNRICEQHFRYCYYDRCEFIEITKAEATEV